MGRSICQSAEANISLLWSFRNRSKLYIYKHLVPTGLITQCSTYELRSGRLPDSLIRVCLRPVPAASALITSALTNSALALRLDFGAGNQTQLSVSHDLFAEL